MFPFRTNQSRHAEMAITDVHAHPDKFEGLHLEVSDDVPFMDLNAFYSDDTKLANDGQRPIQLKTEPYTQHSRSCSDSSNSDDSSYIADDRSSIYSVPTPSESLCSESTTLYELAGPDTPSMSCDGDHSDLPPTYNEEIFLLEMPLLPPPSPPIHLNRHCSLHRSAEVVKHWTRRTAHHSSEIPDTEKKTMSATITTIVPFADVVPYPELEPLLKASRSRRTTVPSHARFSFVECRRIPSRTNQEACSRDSPIHISSMLELEDIGNAEGDEHPIPTAELDKKPILGSGNEQDLPNKQLPVAHLGTRRPTTLMIQSRSNTFSHLRARTQLLQLHIPERSPKRIEEVRALIPEPLQLARRLTRAERRHEIEQVPMVRNVELHTNEIERSSRVWAKTRFLSGHKAMQMKMTRSVATSSTVDWAIESGNGSNLLGCIGQSHSSSRRTDFYDPIGEHVFQFQKRTGSMRVAEAADGNALFNVKPASLSSLPHWTVTLGTEVSSSSHSQWTAKGDEDMQGVIVSWGGFQVGRISSQPSHNKHTYIVHVAPEMNYCIMAALTTIFDDLRTDQGCCM